MPPGRPHSSTKPKPGQIRIIGGKHGSRKLRFPAVEGLRPTPDAARETLFNWLMPDIRGSSCLDLFSGSGALGFEAISRGALTATMVDSSPAAAKQLSANADALGESAAITIVNVSAARFLASCSTQFNVVFLDPPYQGALLGEAVEQLTKRRLLTPGALVYIEVGSSPSPLPIPATWHIIRQAVYGLVKSYLVRCP